MLSGWYSTPEDANSTLTRVGVDQCTPGWYCVGGYRSLCPGGKYSQAFGQTSCDVCPAGEWAMYAGCDIHTVVAFLCNSCDPAFPWPWLGPGHVCPDGTGVLGMVNQCQSPTAYCPLRSSIAVPTPMGYYAIPTAPGSNAYYNVSICPVGAFCIGGVLTTCSGGRFGNTTGVTVDGCSGPCAAGYYCPPGSTSPTASPCFSGPQRYCPEVRTSYSCIYVRRILHICHCNDAAGNHLHGTVVSL